MSAFRHRPYAEGVKPFAIGLRPIAPRDWIEADERLAAELALKEEIFAAEGEEAFAALPGGEAAQEMIAAALAAHLPERFPDIYEADGEGIRVAGKRVSLRADAPLKQAARLVQEDLLLMQRSDEGWRLTAGALCFPSTWRLGDKLGRPMEAIHAPVPGFAGAMGDRIRRIFDHLPSGERVERFNLSIYGDAELRHAVTRAPAEKFSEGRSALALAHLRVERQTLWKLAPGDILFTVRTYLDPLAHLARRPDGASLATALAAHLREMTPEQRAYKGIEQGNARLMAAIEEIARDATTSPGSGRP